jgi:hypothetical protein
MKQQTGKDLTRLNITLPTELWDWLKSQSDKANISASFYLAKLIEKDKKFFEITEKKS